MVNQKHLSKLDKRFDKGNETKFKLDFGNIYVLGGVSAGGLLILSCSFYIAWNCGLREKVENLV